MSRQKSIVSKIQIGKNGITSNFLSTLKSYFVKHTIVKISVLKNNLEEFDNKKEKIKEYSEKILSELGKSYTAKTIGHTIIIQKWRKEKR